MTAANGIDRDAGAAQTALRRCAANVAAAFAMLVRPLRIHVRNPWPLAPQQLAIAAGLAVVIFLLAMFLIDAAAIRGVGHLPRWIVWFFDQITDFGKSGWFLWPLGILFLVLAALPSLPRMPQLVLTAIMVRVGFLFVAIAVPSLFGHRGQAHDRPGAASWSAAASILICSARSVGPPTMPGCRPATPPRPSPSLVAFGTLWPRARTILWIYALLIAVSRVVVTAHYPSDVLAGAVVGVVGALLVRRWFALRGLGFSIAPDGVLHQKPGPSLRRIKSVARALLGQ